MSNEPNTNEPIDSKQDLFDFLNALYISLRRDRREAYIRASEDLQQYFGWKDDFDL